MDYSQHQLLIKTRNSLYHCPLKYCKFEKQDEYSDLIPDYEYIKENYKDKSERQTIEPGERKEFCKENAEDEEIFLARGDLYPAVIID